MNKTYRYLTYKKEDGTCIDIRVSNEDNDCWLTVDEIANLYSKDRTSITRHILAIFKSKGDKILDSKQELKFTDYLSSMKVKNDEEPSVQKMHISPLNSVQKMHIITPNLNQ